MPLMLMLARIMKYVKRTRAEVSLNKYQNNCYMTPFINRLNRVSLFSVAVYIFRDIRKEPGRKGNLVLGDVKFEKYSQMRYKFKCTEFIFRNESWWLFLDSHPIFPIAHSELWS